MSAYAGRVKFETDIPLDQQELVRLHGWKVAFALGVPLTFEAWRSPMSKDGYVSWHEKKSTCLKRVSPYRPEDGASFEERVWGGLDHIMHHLGEDVSDKLQVECSLASWHEACYHGCLTGWVVPNPPRAVQFKDRRGWLQGETVGSIPVVVVSDVGKPVLRPRWPETIRLVQGG